MDNAVNARTTHAFETLYVTTLNELLDNCQAGVDRLASRIVRWSRIQFTNTRTAISTGWRLNDEFGSGIRFLSLDGRVPGASGARLYISA
jgi:hypothetical protein